MEFVIECQNSLKLEKKLKKKTAAAIKSIEFWRSEIARLEKELPELRKAAALKRRFPVKKKWVCDGANCPPMCHNVRCQVCGFEIHSDACLGSIASKKVKAEPRHAVKCPRCKATRNYIRIPS
jgi:hypothetical protein